LHGGNFVIFRPKVPKILIFYFIFLSLKIQQKSKIKTIVYWKRHRRFCVYHYSTSRKVLECWLTTFKWFLPLSKLWHNTCASIKQHSKQQEGRHYGSFVCTSNPKLVNGYDWSNPKPYYESLKFLRVDCVHFAPCVNNIPPTYEPMTSHEPVKVLHTTL
jgi:hypothetical protein